MTKIFCDIADIKLIKRFNSKSMVKGFTTNPSLMRKTGGKYYRVYSQKILKIINKLVSCQVFADDEKNVKLQGKKLVNGREMFT
jgi:transaldolase|tara:strand:- start:48 stop:299 length:252 start_codon:yes stop_codon:yes gene_type:complete